MLQDHLAVCRVGWGDRDKAIRSKTEYNQDSFSLDRNLTELVWAKCDIIGCYNKMFRGGSGFRLNSNSRMSSRFSLSPPPSLGSAALLSFWCKLSLHIVYKRAARLLFSQWSKSSICIPIPGKLLIGVAGVTCTLMNELLMDGGGNGYSIWGDCLGHSCDTEGRQQVSQPWQNHTELERDPQRNQKNGDMHWEYKDNSYHWTQEQNLITVW